MFLKTGMKLTGAVGLVLISLSAWAQTPIDVVKNIYVAEIETGIGAMAAIKAQATPELRRLIAKVDALADAHEGEMCEWVYDAHPLIPGNDFDVTVKSMTFRSLPNGRVRAQGRNFGQNFKVDFEMVCQGGSCQVSNLFTPRNYRHTLQKIVKNGTC